LEIGQPINSENCSELQNALHAKAKAEAGYRFYALYDKISREDILAHAHAQCRSNKGAPGVDGQDFADIEAYGVQRWLGELALALREESYQPNPRNHVGALNQKKNCEDIEYHFKSLRVRICSPKMHSQLTTEKIRAGPRPFVRRP
jgi:RNA-directed DNA polymerase